MQTEFPEAAAALEAWGLAPDSIAPLGEGLINLTLIVKAGRDRLVLQRVNPVFPAGVNDDIDRITAHLAARGLPTPRLVRTRDGESCLRQPDGVWRALEYIDGVGLQALADPAQARDAGAALARFHRALDDLQIDFANPRLGVHDTTRHLQALETALADHRDHPEYSRVAPLAGEILERAAALPELPVLPDRIVHGDPKINNLLFDPEGRTALCWIDLDTVTRMPLPLELGDALRSWCNPGSEDQRDGRFRADLFAAALQGYAPAVSGWITEAEREAIVPATQRITLELAARFCTDALNENYFGWNPDRFATRSLHNQARAAGQLALARSQRDQAMTMSDVVNSVFD